MADKAEDAEDKERIEKFAGRFSSLERAIETGKLHAGLIGQDAAPFADVTWVNGDSIEPGDLEMIFDKFRQVDNRHDRGHEGTGLGLALCRDLLHLMGGDIRVESTPGKGSAFIVTLPIETRDPGTVPV